MIERMDERGPSISEQDIKLVESVIGIALPREYKNFLLAHNGGRPTPNAFPIEGFEKNPYGVIQVFFGINDTVESCNLDWNYEVMSGRVPDNLLPIARDDGGDLICLSLYGNDAGAVVFWDFYAEHSPPTYRNIYRIAPSFDEFIDGLCRLPKPEGEAGDNNIAV